MSAALRLLTFLLALSTQSRAEQRSCRFKKIDRAIHSAFLARNLTASSRLACTMHSCGPCDSRCALTFLGGGRDCWMAPLSALLVAWLQPHNITTSAPASSFSFVQSESTALERPSALWLMDSVFGCRNLGAKGGAALDCAGTGVAWTAAGPVAGSRVRYARFKAGSRLRIQLQHDSNLVLNFRQTFTVALWVKTDSVPDVMPILEGVETIGHQAIHLWFYPDQSTLYVKGIITKQSSRNATGRFVWRHIALVNDANIKYGMFLNGAMLPGATEKIGLSGLPQIMQIGYREPNLFFLGSMACIAFYERTLSAFEIQTLMHACP